MTQSDVLIRYSEAKEALGGGCSDGYCCVEKPTGMHTNGGCKCASNPDFLRQQRMANIMRLAQEMSSEITRLRAALDERLVASVKPLVWEPCEDWKVCSKERAPAFGGEYQMVLLDPKDDPRPSLYFEIGLGAFMFRFEQGEPDHLGPTGPKKFPTFAAAKAAAQADYTARILSAITTTTAASVRAEALREAAALGNVVEYDDIPSWADKGSWVHAVEIFAMRIIALIDAPEKSE